MSFEFELKTAERMKRKAPKDDMFMQPNKRLPASDDEPASTTSSSSTDEENNDITDMMVRINDMRVNDVEIMKSMIGKSMLKYRESPSTFICAFKNAINDPVFM